MHIRVSIRDHFQIGLIIRSQVEVGYPQRFASLSCECDVVVQAAVDWHAVAMVPADVAVADVDADAGEGGGGARYPVQGFAASCW